MLVHCDLRMESVHPDTVPSQCRPHVQCLSVLHNLHVMPLAAQILHFSIHVEWFDIVAVSFANQSSV